MFIYTTKSDRYAHTHLDCHISENILHYSMLKNPILGRFEPHVRIDQEVASQVHLMNRPV